MYILLLLKPKYYIHFTLSRLFLTFFGNKTIEYHVIINSIVVGKAQPATVRLY